MPFPWSGKKGPTEADGPELFESSDDRAPAGNAPGELDTLAEGLGSLGTLLGRINQQIAAYLGRQQSEVAAAGAAAELARKIDAVGHKIDQLAADGPPRGPASGPPAIPAAPAAAQEPPGQLQAALERIEQKLDAIGAPPAAAGPAAAHGAADAIDRLQRRMEEGLAQLADRLAPPKKTAGSPAGNAEWERAILGSGLAAHPGLEFQRQQLLRGVLESDASACSLAGQLLVFQSAPAERMPQLLKDIGEAYYRWQPKTRPGSNPMEQALVDWLKAVCDKAGIANTIELVHPGERFDSTRHTALSRGVEVAEVCGWIVLRDNGKVYTKANVVAR